MFLAAAAVDKALPEIIVSWRPIIIVLIPIIAAPVVYFLSLKVKRLAAFLSALVGVITFALVFSLLPMVQGGIVEYRFADIMSIGLLFRVDLLSFIFAFLISLAWMLSLFYATAYMQIERQQELYFSFALLTLGSCLGVVLTGDLVSLFLFFELLTVSSFVLVACRLNKEAIEAGMFTLYMGIAGGLVMLFGIFALYSTAGTVELAPLMEILATRPGINPAIIFACLFIGFAIKAGVIPLHLWMPRAYTASSAAVNALSSGAMIKAGIYGILRISMLVFAPASLEMRELLAFPISTGYIVMWLGLLTMVGGAFLALFQSNIMRLLAYSSISQMGYIVTSIGAGAYVFGAEEAMGYSGAVLHSFNHTLFKTAFFLIVGIIFYRTGELEIKKLGGIAKKMPLLTMFFVLSVFAIAGVPGLNGFISKTLIHDTLLEAIKLYGTLDLVIAEKVFTIGGAFTLCYYLKFLQGVFLGREKKGTLKRRVPWLMYVPLFILAVFMVAVGVLPNFFVDEFVLASADVFTFEPYGIEHVLGFHFFDSHPVEAAIFVIALAIVIYIPLSRRKVFDKQLPQWMSIERLVFIPLTTLMLKLLCRYGSKLNDSVNNFYYGVGISFLRFCRRISSVDSELDGLYMRSGSKTRELLEKTRELDLAINRAYESTGRSARQFSEHALDIDGIINKSYEVTGRAALRVADRTQLLEEALDDGFIRSGEIISRLIGKTWKFEKALDEAYFSAETSAKGLVYKTAAQDKSADKKKYAREKIAGKRLVLVGITRERPTHAEDEKTINVFNPMEWNIRNINFDQLLMAIMLGLVIFVLFYYGRDMVGM